MNSILYSWLKHTAELYPQKTAYTTWDQSITFGELFQQAMEVAIAGQLRGQAAVVPVTAARELHVPITYLGIAFAGGTYAPIPKELPMARLQALMISLSMGTYPEGEKPLMVVQTSGTTSMPKGVCIPESAVCHYLESFGTAMNIGPDEVLGCQCDFDYVAAIRDLYLPVRYGCTTAIIPKDCFVNPMKLHSFLRDNHVTTLCWSVAAMTTMAKLGALQDFDFSFIKKVIFTGSQIPGGILHQWQMALPDATFINHYGPSEATASCTYYVVDHPVKTFERIPIGKPLTGYEVTLSDCDANGEGEIVIAGKGLASGYYGAKELTRSKFVIATEYQQSHTLLNHIFGDILYLTGDLGKMDENGNLLFLGRKDRQIKHMDYRIELDGIEAAVTSLPDIEEAAVVNDEVSDKIIMYYVGDTTPETIIPALRQQLPSYMMPRVYKQVASIPKLASGKTDYMALTPKRETKPVPKLE